MKKKSTKDLSLSSNERLFLESGSIFSPKKIDNMLPERLKILTFHSGFKKKLDDLLIIIFDGIVNSYKIYSKTSTPSAPIIWNKKNSKNKTKALIVNSGNANAHTGVNGIKIIDDYVKLLSNKIECNKSEIIVCSTGVIGEIFDPNIIKKQIEKIKYKKETDLFNAAKSIMTTDTYPKICIKKVKIQNHSVKIFGIAKGSGMIMPNMGTMLAFIFIEAKLSINILKKLIYSNLEDTFNSISVDSDTSTSDTLALFSISQKKIDCKNKKNLEKINSTLKDVMADLSLKVIKDGEGCTKLIKVNIFEAKTKIQAKNIGLSIINSPLVKTAVSGEDANWGRVIMAIGKSKENIDQNKIKIFFGKNLVCSNGEKNGSINIKKLDQYMQRNIIEINVYLKNGTKRHTVIGNDLSYDYIKINADYRS